MLDVMIVLSTVTLGEMGQRKTMYCSHCHTRPAGSPDQLWCCPGSGWLKDRKMKNKKEDAIRNDVIGKQGLKAKLK